MSYFGEKLLINTHECPMSVRAWVVLNESDVKLLLIISKTLYINNKKVAGISFMLTWGNNIKK